MARTAIIYFLCGLFCSVRSQEFDNEFLVDNLTVTKTELEDIILTWDINKKPDFYNVYIEAPENYPSFPKKTTYNAKIKINSLSPGVQYKFGVSSISNQSESDIQYVTYQSEGVELPQVTGVKIEHVGTNKFCVTWNPLNITNVTYGIYISDNSSNVDKEICLKTDDHFAEIRHLKSCKTYFLNVGLVGYINGPLSNEIVNVTTMEDQLAKPLNLTAEMDNHNYGKLIVKWKSSCENIQEPIGYYVILRDYKENSMTFLDVPISRNTTFQARFRVSYGSAYDIKVSTSHYNSIPAKISRFLTPQVLEPYNLQINCSEHSINLTWRRPIIPEHIVSYLYEVSIQNEPYEMKVDVESMPFHFKLANANSNYTYSVLLKSSDGKIRSRMSKKVSCIKT